MKRLTLLLMFVIFQFGMLQNAHAASNEVVITKAPLQSELAANATLLRMKTMAENCKQIVCYHKEHLLGHWEWLWLNQLVKK